MGESTFRIEVHLQPRAKRAAIVGWHGGALKVQVTAPPVDGAANAALIDLLAATLGVSRSRLRLVRGETNRSKLVEVRTDDEARCRRLLNEATQ